MKAVDIPKLVNEQFSKPLMASSPFVLLDIVSVQSLLSDIL
jgi:hypothetical protein